MIFVLVEHWSSADKLDPLRTARYLLGIEASASVRDDFLQGFMKGYAEGFAKGFEIGRRAGSLKHAGNLLEQGVSWEIITSATGVKPEDLSAEG